MRAIQLRPAAIEDLTDIFDYSFTIWGIDQAQRYLARMAATFEQIAADPRIGKPASERHSTLLRHPYGSHVIIFARGAKGIEIIRVLHRRMDVDGRLD